MAYPPVALAELERDWVALCGSVCCDAAAGGAELGVRVFADDGSWADGAGSHGSSVTLFVLCFQCFHPETGVVPKRE